MDQEEMIQQEIIRQTNLLKRIRQSQQVLHDAKENVGKFRIEERPGIYRMNTQRKIILYLKEGTAGSDLRMDRKRAICFFHVLYFIRKILKKRRNRV